MPEPVSGHHTGAKMVLSATGASPVRQGLTCASRSGLDRAIKNLIGNDAGIWAAWYVTSVLLTNVKRCSLFFSFFSNDAGSKPLGVLSTSTCRSFAFTCGSSQKHRCVLQVSLAVYLSFHRGAGHWLVRSHVACMQHRGSHVHLTEHQQTSSWASAAVWRLNWRQRQKRTLSSSKILSPVPLFRGFSAFVTI